MIHHVLFLICLLYAAKAETEELVSSGRNCTSTPGHQTACNLVTDGNMATYHPKCYHSALVAKPWLQIDLGEVRCLKRIVITTRQECCTDRLRYFRVYVKQCDNADSLPEQMCNHFDKIAQKYQVLNLTCTKCGRYVRIENGGPTLQLCEVKVYAAPKEVLVSAGKPCTSTPGHETTCNLATDGNMATYHPKCYHSQLVTKPWLQIDLGQVQCLSRIEITTRQECCFERLKYFKVFVKHLSTETDSDSEKCFEFDRAAKKNEVIKFPCGMCGRYVRIENGGETLQLCEVKVYAQP